MSDTKQRVFVPGSSAKAKDLDFGTVTNLSFDVDELAKFAKQHKKEGKNGKKYLNLSIVPRKEKGQYGDTHSVQLDTWEPKESTSQAPKSKAAQKPSQPQAETPDDDDVPF